AAGGPASGGGAGSPLGLGGTTSAASDGGNTDPSARYAEIKKSSDDYGSGGTFMGGGGGGGAGGDAGPDLSGLLAQFLPKKEDENGPSKSIKDFGRDPASNGPVS